MQLRLSDFQLICYVSLIRDITPASQHEFECAQSSNESLLSLSRCFSLQTVKDLIVAALTFDETFCE